MSGKTIPDRKTFRVFMVGAGEVDVDAVNPTEARTLALERHPAAIIKKIKLVRENVHG